MQYNQVAVHKRGNPISIIQSAEESERKMFYLQTQAQVDPNMKVSGVTIAVKYYPAEYK